VAVVALAALLLLLLALGAALLVIPEMHGHLPTSLSLPDYGKKKRKKGRERSSYYTPGWLLYIHRRSSNAPSRRSAAQNGKYLAKYILVIGHCESFHLVSL
jgi:hypothetical protein